MEAAQERERPNGVRPQAQEGDGGGPGASPYSRLGQRMQDITGDRGVLKEVVRTGSGDPVPQDASVLEVGYLRMLAAGESTRIQAVSCDKKPEAGLWPPWKQFWRWSWVISSKAGPTVKFSGYLENTDRPFDTNCFRRNPRLMRLGEDITLGGMEVGLLTMRKGELARFLFKPRYAFGTVGCPPLIPPNATVLFEVELLDFLDSAESDRFFDLTPEQQERFPLQVKLKVADTEREFGNYLFRQKHFMDARERYKRASSVLQRASAEESEQAKVDEARLLVFLNLSFTYLKLERPARALAYGEKALELDPKSAKALFRCGQACLSLAEYEKARDFLVRAQREQPFNHDINNALKQLASCYGEYLAKEKEMCGRMFGPCSSPPAEAELKSLVLQEEGPS